MILHMRSGVAQVRTVSRHDKENPAISKIRRNLRTRIRPGGLDLPDLYGERFAHFPGCSLEGDKEFGALIDVLRRGDVAQDDYPEHFGTC